MVKVMVEMAEEKNNKFDVKFQVVSSALVRVLSRKEALAGFACVDCDKHCGGINDCSRRMVARQGKVAF